MTSGENAFQILSAALDPEDHESERDYPGLVYITEEFIDHRRWVGAPCLNQRTH